jgi:hypothetical protein
MLSMPYDCGIKLLPSWPGSVSSFSGWVRPLSQGLSAFGHSWFSEFFRAMRETCYYEEDFFPEGPLYESSVPSYFYAGRLHRS